MPVKNSSLQSIGKVILVTSVIAGTLDGLAALVHVAILTGGKNPLIVFRFIASGIFGKEAQSYNFTLMVMAGILFHYLIAASFTAFYFWVYPKTKFLHKSWIVSGIVYGLAVWFVMNRIVLPLSNIPPIPFSLPKAVLAATILIFMIGIPIAWSADKYYSAK